MYPKILSKTNPLKVRVKYIMIYQVGKITTEQLSQQNIDVWFRDILYHVDSWQLGSEQDLSLQEIETNV